MSYTSQPTNTRSMNGIIAFDDGAGGVLEDGVLSADHSNTTTSEVDNITVDNQLNLVGSIYANALTITPTWVSYLHGLTGNIQNQLSSIISTILASDNTWTGAQTFSNNKVNTEFIGSTNSLPSWGSAQRGAIYGFGSSPRGLTFMNNHNSTTSTHRAFSWYKMFTASIFTELMNISNAGDLTVIGNLISPTADIAVNAFAITTKQELLTPSYRLDASLIGANGNVSNTEYGYLSNVTADIQAQFNNKQNTIDSSNRLSATLIGANGNVSDTEYGYLSSVTSDIQTQLDGKGGLTATQTWTQPQTYSEYATFNNGIFVTGTTQSGFVSTAGLTISDVSTLNRQYVTITIISADTTYSSTDLPSYISCNTAGVTITLPTASSIGSGFICTILNTHTTGTLTVDSTSNFRYNTQPWPVTTGSAVNNSTPLVLEPCQTLRLISNPSIWSII